MPDKVWRRGLLVLPKHHRNCDLIFRLVRPQCISRDFGHGRMIRSKLLNFESRDVLATPADHVLHPIDKPEVSIFVEIAAIAGVKPFITTRMHSLLRRVVIAARTMPGVTRAQHTFADLSCWQWYV